VLKLASREIEGLFRDNGGTGLTIKSKERYKKVFIVYKNDISEREKNLLKLKSCRNRYASNPRASLGQALPLL
jgi:hypothetical protein